MIRRGPHPAVVAVVAGLDALVVAAVQGLPALQILFALPLVFAIPGYALSAALFPRQEIDPPRRLLLSVGLSLSLAIVTGLVLHVTAIGLNSRSWVVALLLSTWTSCVGAFIRRRGTSEIGAAVLAPLRMRPRRRDIVLLVLAACILGGAVAFARTPLPAVKVQGYTALWLLPGPGGHGSSLRIGVKSGELTRTRYRLVVRVGSQVVHERRFQLEPSGELNESVRVSGAAREANIEALLYREGQPRSVYRLARILPATQATRHR